MCFNIVLIAKCFVPFLYVVIFFFHVQKIQDTTIACSVLLESNVKYERVIYWSDSAATLHLIRNSTRRFGVFVDARLAEIRNPR